MGGNTLIIRADAGTRMGMGHVMRCMALGQAWKDAGGQVIFICCCDSENVLTRMEDEGFELVKLSESYPSSEGDLETTLQTAAKSGATWIVTDGYQFDLEYDQAVRKAGFKLLRVDDYSHRPAYEADILLNQNVSATTIDYKCNRECRKLLGTKYVMLRREFRRASAGKEESEAVGKILVTMGGSDPDNATLQVLAALSTSVSRGLQIKIIVGPVNPHRAALEKFICDSALEIHLIDSVRDMPSLIGWADFAVSAAGSTCWELAALGVPFATVVLAENQQELALELEKQAAVFCAGWVDEGFAERLSEHVSALLVDSNILEPCRKGLAGLVDCFGVDRVLSRPASEAGLNLFSGRLVLREATPEDAELLFSWSNDSATRANSFNADPISWDGHVQWLQNKLQADDTALYMMDLDGVSCGHVRYDLEDGDCALLSFVVAPEFRGMGLGMKLVEMSCAKPFSLWPLSTIKAVSFVENVSSSRVFERLGFTKEAVEEIKGRPCNVYRWSAD